MYREERPQKGCGALVAYIRADLRVVRRQKFEPTNIESICLVVKTSNNTRLIVCGSYRSPDLCPQSDFIDVLSSATAAMYMTRQEVLLLDDFNMDMYENMVENRYPNRNLLDFCQRFGLVNMITKPTRVTDKSKTLIDVILTSHKERFSTAGNFQLGVSDHDLIFIFRRNKATRPKPNLIEYRSMKDLTSPNFLKIIWAHWRDLYKSVLDQHAPLKKKWVRGDQLLWISRDILREISHRNKLFKRHRKNPSADSWEVYRNKGTK